MRRIALNTRMARLVRATDDHLAAQALTALSPAEIEALCERLQQRYLELTGTSLTPVLTVAYLNNWDDGDSTGIEYAVERRMSDVS